MYFVHQRATRLAIWNLFLLGGIAGASFISGYVIENLGYRWTFGICGILFGVFGLGILFFVPETSYNRLTPELIDLVARNDKQSIGDKAEYTEHVKPRNSKHQRMIATPVDPKRSYLRSISLYNGVFSDAPFWKILARPFVMFFYPAVLWGFLIYGTTLTWIVVFSVVNGVIFFKPPYNFTVGEVGLTGLSPFILTIIGEMVAGPSNDWICLKLTKWNHGVYEPEFRLVLMAVVVILGTAGFYGFGATVHYATHWTGPVLTYGFANMSLAFASTCVFGYVLDSYPKQAEEAFVAINARNFLTFGLTYFVNAWLAKDGPLNVFNILGSAFLGVCALTVPLWIFGKRIRGTVAGMEGLQRFMND
jgi:MFS family permease